MFKTYYFERITQQLSYPAQSQLLYDPTFIDVWLIWFGLSIVGICLTIVTFIGIRGAYLVSLDLLLTYFWGIAIFIIPLILGLFSCLNYGFYNDIWFRHSWPLSNFHQVRKIFCVPSSTANTKCLVPFSSSEYSYYNASSHFNGTLWCLENYHATDCVTIRDHAINNAILWGSTIIDTLSFVGLFSLLLIGYAMYISYSILTSPVITQSMLDIINYLLIFPIGGYAMLTGYFWYVIQLDIPQRWLPIFYAALAVVQVFALPLGILAGRLKSRMLLTIYIVIMVLLAMSFAAAAGIGWTMSNYVNYEYKPPESKVAELACNRGLPGCTSCSTNPRICPQWSKSEVITLISLDLRLAGVTTILSILYIIGGLIVAALFDHSLQNYKTDFI